MPTALTWTSYQAQLGSLLVLPNYAVNADFQVILPEIVNYAELRILRELDLITVTTEGTVPLVAGTRTATIPSSIIICNSANLITPAATAPAAGTRNPLQRISLEMLNYMYPSSAVADRAAPEYYAMLTDTTMVFAPTPDAAYQVEAIGPIRPATLSAVNTTTWISTNLPDLFIAASMIFASGYQQNFGAQADDPKMAQSWEMQYQALVGGAQVEEARRRAASTGWQPFSPAPLAQPSR